MTLGRLGISNIRNIRSASLELDPGINVFLGPNGSGKTSLLEAVNFLGSARTFRSASVDPLITRGESTCTVFGVVLDGQGNRTQMGVTRDRDGGREIRINGADVKRASELARNLPTLVLGPNTVELLTGPPGDRRRFLNWGVFHVEHTFAETWERANRCLRQRNELLRRPATSDAELTVWDTRLDALAGQIDARRSAWFEAFQASFRETCESLAGMKEVSCSYQKGWEGAEGLAPVLQRQRSSDLQRGYTQSGHHRAELLVRVGKAPATSVCSRGELKILAWAMVLAQGRVYAGQPGLAPVYLVDDLAAELDAGHRERVCEVLAGLPGQVLATGIEEVQLRGCWPSGPRMFHVEHGRFSVEESVDERQ